MCCDMIDTRVEVEIGPEGKLIEFLRAPSGVDFEIDGSSVSTLSIKACMTAIKNHSARVHARSEKSDPDSTLTVRLESITPWEKNLSGVVFVDIYGTICRSEFNLITAIGTKEAVIRGTVSSLTMRSGFALLEIRPDNDGMPVRGDVHREWTVELSCVSEDAVFADLFTLRHRLSQAVFLPADMITSPQHALRMIQISRIDALVGLQESEWLEAKSTPYDLRPASSKPWKLEIAKDIAQFANAEAGGLLVIGLRTRRIDGIDTIDQITAFPPDSKRVQSYRDTIKERIYPPIVGLELDAVQINGSHVIYAFVPPQRDDNKPYLVSGTVIDDGVYESQGITIVRRHGDASITITAREIHSALAAGAAVLRNRGRSGGAQQ